MLYSNRCVRLTMVMVLLFIMLSGIALYAQKTTPQVLIEARFIEVNVDDMRSFGIDFKFEGPEDAKVGGVKIGMGDGFDENAKAVTLPEGWDLDLSFPGSYYFGGTDELKFPLQFELLQNVEPPVEIKIEWIRVGRQTSPLDTIFGDTTPRKINILPMELGDVPALRPGEMKEIPDALDTTKTGVVKPQGKIKLSTIIGLNNVFGTVDDLETSAKTYEAENDTFGDMTVFGDPFSGFPGIEFGATATYGVSKNVAVGLVVGHSMGLKRTFEQGWSWDQDPTFSGLDQFDFNYSCFSLGAALEISMMEFGDSPLFGHLDLISHLNLHFGHLNVDVNSEMNGGGMLMWDRGTLKANSVGFSIDVGGMYNFWNNFSLGLNLGYNAIKFDDITGDLTDEQGETHENRLIMSPKQLGDYIKVRKTDQPLGEGMYPATIEIQGFTVSLGLYYEIPIGLFEGSNKGKDKDDDPGTSPDDTPPPTIYGEEIETDENVWNAYVYIGSISGNAAIYEAAIIATADEAQSDFEDAGYNVIPNYKATVKDFQTVLDDPQAKAFWFAGHGTEDDDKTPLPMIREANGEAITASRQFYPSEASLVFHKPNLNQVTMHACKQDLPEWWAAFVGATYKSWSISPIGPMMYWWQLAASYPDIDQETGREIGK